MSGYSINPITVYFFAPLLTLLFVPRLSEHERPGAIGTLKAGVRVSGVARYYNCHPSTIQHLKDCYWATVTVKGRYRPGQLRMATDIKTATDVEYIEDICIDDIRQTNRRAPRVICFRFLIKFFNYNNLKSCQISYRFQIAALESKGTVF